MTSKPKAKAAAIDALVGQGGMWGKDGKLNKADKDAKSSDGEKEVTKTPGKKRRTPMSVAASVAPLTSSLVDQLNLAKNRTDIGVVQKIHRNVRVLDNIDDLRDLSLSAGTRLFVRYSLIKVWGMHDRSRAGSPNVDDIKSSIRLEGQEEPCKVRFDDSDGELELIAGFRRYVSVGQCTDMYLLCDAYTKQEMPDPIAWIEMTRENNLDRKKAVPISAQVASDEFAIANGLFKSKRELSLAAGKGEGWAKTNALLFNSVPQPIADKAGTELMATLAASDYRKLGKVFKSREGVDQSKVDTLLAEEELFSETLKFPVAKVLSLLNTQFNSDKVKALSTNNVKVKVDGNGNISLSLGSNLTLAQIEEIVKSIESLPGQ
mgnify:CR=1 FL=1